MNALDRFISAVSPARGLKRAQQRARTLAVETAIRMAYDGATQGRRAGGWSAVGTDVNAEVRVGAARLSYVARELVRNNPYARRAKKILADNVVGTGIIPNVQTKSKRYKKLLLELSKAHFDTTACDAHGQTNLYGIQWQVMAAVAESGEALVRWRPRRRSDGLPLPFQLELLEKDQLDATKDGALRGGGRIVQGIEFDALNRRVAYWIYREHPGSDRMTVRVDSDRVPASEIAHIFEPERPNQIRGVTWFAPVILKMKDLADYADAQLVRQKVAACFAVFITSEDDVAIGSDGSAPRSDTGGTYPVESLEPGLIQRLKGGEEVSFGTPPPVGDYEAYKRVELREIAAGLGIPYEALTGDLSGVNFSSGRMGWLEFQRLITRVQNFMMVPQLCTHLERWFLEGAARTIGAIPADTKIMWTPPRREMINPKEETAAARDAIRAGLSSRSHEQRKLGFDPEDLEAEIVEDNERADALELIFDSDPRYRTAAGNPVTEPAEEEPEEENPEESEETPPEEEEGDDDA